MTGEDSGESIETFARYSAELKEYIHKNVTSTEVKAYAGELPKIEYAQPKFQLWQYLHCLRGGLRFTGITTKETE